MNKTSLICVALCSFAATISVAQMEPPGLTSASRAYHQGRLIESEPPYELGKVKALIANTKPIEEPDADNVVLSKKDFNSLSVKGKFTYCMIHGEVGSQNCDGMPALLNEEHYIYSEPSAAFGNEMDWSERQINFLHANRQAVIQLLRSTIATDHRVGVNLKKAIIELNAWELIPDMVRAFNSTHKDQDVLSTLSVLMKQGKFKPFLKSITYRKLYGANSDYQSYIIGNSANQKLTVERALAYFKSRQS